MRINEVPMGSIKSSSNVIHGRNYDIVQKREREREQENQNRVRGAKLVSQITPTDFVAFFHWIYRDLNYYYYSLLSLLCYWTMISYHSFKLQTIVEQKWPTRILEEKRLLLHIASDNNNGRFNKKWASNNNCIFIVWNT